MNIDRLLSTYSQFISQNRALLYGISMLIAALLATSNLYVIIFIIILVPILKINLTRGLLLASTLIFFYLYSTSIQVTPQKPGATEGYAYIKIDNIYDNSNTFGKSWVYKGKILAFDDGKSVIARNIPYVMYLKKKGERPPAKYSYILKGTLSKTRGYYYRLKPDKDHLWWPQKKLKNLTELRYNSKNKITKFIYSNFKDKTTAKFLIGITTGIYDDNYTLFHMSKLGLQHIMAISGFHFAIITLFISLILRALLPYKISNYILILMLTSYFIFIGFSASIQRAWFSSIVVLAGQLYGKPSYTLNNLGLALIITLLIDPMICQNIGFQFSFLTTSSIIIFYPIFHSKLCKILPKRSTSEILCYDHLSQWSCILLGFLRKAIALSLAVHLTTIPLMLVHFGKFPLMSLVTNLIFPFIISLSIYIFILIIPIYIIAPWLARPLFSILEKYISLSLNSIKDFPPQYNIEIYLALPSLVYCVYLMLLFYIIIRHNHKTLEITFI